jgi:hypothetical protein
MLPSQPSFSFDSSVSMLRAGLILFVSYTANVADSGQLPDPRFRRLALLGELQNLVHLVAAKNGLTVRITVVEDRSGAVAVARFQGTALSGRIEVNPSASRNFPPNTWAFIIAHELAHAVDAGAKMQPGRSLKEAEWAADEIGAVYARNAGFSLEAQLAWVFSRPDAGGPSHGSDHERATRLGNLHRITPATVHRLIPYYVRPLR